MEFDSICALKAGQKPLHEKWPQAPNEIQAVVLRVGGAFPQLYLNGQPEEVEDSAAMVMSGSRPHYPPRDPKKKVCVESKICPNLPDLVEDMFPFFLEIIYIYINVNKSKSQHFLQHFVGRLLDEV